MKRELETQWVVVGGGGWCYDLRVLVLFDTMLRGAPNGGSKVPNV